MKPITAILIISFILPCGCALQRDVYSLEDRVTALEKRNLALEQRSAELDKYRSTLKNQLQDFGKNRQSEEQKLRSNYAGLKATTDALDDKILQLQGKIDEVEYLVNQSSDAVKGSETKASEQVSYLSEDLKQVKERLSALESYLNMETGSSMASSDQQPAAKTSAEQQTAKTSAEKSTAKSLYEEAKRAFDSGDNDKARSQFEELLKKFPKSENADNAQFWIGEIYSREKWYEKAILEYQKVIENYPKGNKVPAALLKQGLAFRNIGDKPNARLILNELVKKYPNSNEGGIAKQKLTEF